MDANPHAPGQTACQTHHTFRSPESQTTVNHTTQLGYTCFGFASTFFNVIGSFAPLAAFSVKYVTRTGTSETPS